MDSWISVPELFRAGTVPLPPPWEAVFGPLRAAKTRGTVVVGQLGQSLDGRIAAPSGHSHYINGPAGLAHLHRLRALVDAVVIGIGTALADDPQLTVRRVSGLHPVRVVIDPSGRLPASARLLADDGVRCIVLSASAVRPPLPHGIEIVELPNSGGQIAPSAIVAALAERGLRHILIEGGADTVSRFLAAGCLDRLHLIVAPIVLGSGRVGLALPPFERADQALRVPMHVHRLDDEVMFDCDLSAQRVASAQA